MNIRINKLLFIFILIKHNCLTVYIIIKNDRHLNVIFIVIDLNNVYFNNIHMHVYIHDTILLIN